MICLRCGYCCKHYCVAIVDNPARGLEKENLIVQVGNGTACKHLRGDKPGNYSCSLHNYPWYPDTPCFAHGQIERDPATPCRIGVHVLRLATHRAKNLAKSIQRELEALPGQAEYSEKLFQSE